MSHGLFIALKTTLHTFIALPKVGFSAAIYKSGLIKNYHNKTRDRKGKCTKLKTKVIQKTAYTVSKCFKFTVSLKAVQIVFS